MLRQYVGGALWLRLGRWLMSKSLASQAEHCFRQAAACGGRHGAEAIFQLAQGQLLRGDFRAAAELCEQALQRDRRLARLWCALGAARRFLADMEGAEQAYRRALAIEPDYVQALSNLGEWFLIKGDPQQALANIDRALQLQPTLLEALNNRAAVLYELGRFADSEAAARAAIEVYPDQAALQVNLGNVLLHNGKSRQAIKALNRALAIDPACPEAHVGLAMLLGETHRLGEALAMIEHQIAIKGESAQRLATLALAQQVRGDYLAAEATCQKVLVLQANNVSALETLAGCASARGDHETAIEFHLRALEQNPELAAVASNIAFEATHLPGLTAEQLFAHHRDWSRRFEPACLPQPDFSNAKEMNRRLRVAYVSGDFGRHPVGFLLRDVIRRHDRSCYEIYCYSMMRQDDEITVEIREGSEHWIDALLLSDEELVERIRQDRIDILVDLSGHTAYNRLAAFVHRSAPVQATWIGYFHSTGLRSIDYYLTDPYTTPVGSPQIFSEIPVWLPHTRFCYSPPAYAPVVVDLPMQKNGHVTFGSFNRIEKLVDPVLEAWSRILLAVPDSKLILKAGSLSSGVQCEQLRQRFAEFGLASERLDLRGPSEHPEMLAQYGEIDVALDPFPFNGGMTTLEALWMGVPVVTVDGESVVSRQTASALSNLGMEELIFADVDAYVQGIVSLAAKPDFLANLRRDLRQRMLRSPLCQPEKFARDLEVLYREMWRAWCRGEKLEAGKIFPAV